MISSRFSTWHERHEIVPCEVYAEVARVLPAARVHIILYTSRCPENPFLRLFLFCFYICSGLFTWRKQKGHVYIVIKRIARVTAHGEHTDIPSASKTVMEFLLIFK